MKLTRRILVIALAVLMLMSMATTAFAAEGGTIKTTGDVTYTVYKMFDIEENADGYIYQVTTEWNSFSAPGYMTIKDGYVNGLSDKQNPSDAAAIAALAYTYTNSHSCTALNPVVSSASPLTITEDGYYLLVGSDGTYGAVSVVGGTEEVDVTNKSTSSSPGIPNISKTVDEDSDSVNWVAANTADIGQLIDFKIAITTNKGATNYILHDTMDEGLTFDSITSVKYDGNDVATSNYTLTQGPVTGCGKNCTFHITFDSSFLSTLVNDKELVVEYQAHLNKKAESNIGHTNTAKLTHTNENIEAKVNVSNSTTSTTYQLNVTKKSDKGNILPGASFVLQRGANEYYSVDADGKVTWVTDINSATKKTSADTTGLLEFVGIDADNYTLIETVVPNGYVQAANTNVNIIDKNVSIEVENKLGEPLPETGGIGTTIFYVLGGVLAAGALVLLITKKRMSSAE